MIKNIVWSLEMRGNNTILTRNVSGLLQYSWIFLKYYKARASRLANDCCTSDCHFDECLSWQTFIVMYKFSLCFNHIRISITWYNLDASWKILPFILHRIFRATLEIVFERESWNKPPLVLVIRPSLHPYTWEN